MDEYGLCQHEFLKCWGMKAQSTAGRRVEKEDACMLHDVHGRGEAYQRKALECPKSTSVDYAEGQVFGICFLASENSEFLPHLVVGDNLCV